jgi:hypothetical protein
MFELMKDLQGGEGGAKCVGTVEGAGGGEAM